MKMTTVDIAKVCHEVNRAYCESMGDLSQTYWKDAPKWQQESAIEGVAFHLAHPDATPEDSHKNWLKGKEAEGWTFGNKKDTVHKTHPCMVPFKALPAKQKSKDYIFIQIVHSLRDLV